MTGFYPQPPKIYKVLSNGDGTYAVARKNGYETGYGKYFVCDNPSEERITNLKDAMRTAERKNWGAWR